MLQAFRHLFRRVGHFGKDFSNCVRGFETIEEFEEDWKTLLSRYNLQENDWMQCMYPKVGSCVLT